MQPEPIGAVISRRQDDRFLQLVGYIVAAVYRSGSAALTAAFIDEFHLLHEFLVIFRQALRRHWQSQHPFRSS